jgi:hypothetical protein
MHTHLKSHHKIVRNILQRIAKQTHQPYTKIKKAFVIDGDIEITMRFWQLLHINLPNNPFTEVSHCPDCHKFSLE